MFVKQLADCPEFLAGDNTLLRELLHPDKHSAQVRFSLAHAKLARGLTSRPHHLKTSEVYYILRGCALMHVDRESREVRPGDLIYIPPMARQFIESLGPEDLEFLCIVDPAWQPENEVIDKQVG